MFLLMSHGWTSEWSVAVVAGLTMTAAKNAAALRVHVQGDTMSQDRQRRSAKTVITDMVNEMLYRTTDPDLNVKLNLLQTISAKMGWNDLFERLRSRDKYRIPIMQPDHEATAEGTPEKWWQK